MEITPEKKERRRLSEVEKRKIIGLKLKGMGSKSIARQLQLNPSAVKTFLHRHGRDPEYVATMGLCPCCGSPVDQLPGRKTKKFCSDACRGKFWKAHPKPEQWDSYHEQVCPVCGRIFFAAHETKRKRKYCSRACANRGRALKGEGYENSDT